MRNFINYYDNSLISLEEENSRQENKTNKKRKNTNIYNYSSSDSFFTKLVNSVSKIGQGLKNIMSMKINIENDDNYNQNIYEQVSNRFKTKKDINLIDSASFMEESHSNNKYILKNRNKFEDGSNIDNEDESKMIISHNETKRDINDTENLNINNTISKNPKEEIINTDILRTQDDNDNEVEIKSTFLNKKRENNLKYENLLFEEEKNEKKNKDEDEEIKSNKKQSFIKAEKSFYSRNSITNTNKNEKKSRLNSSIMSLSMKSLDNIKDEINQRREENLRSIEEMHRRHGLNYDVLKERQLREKILNEYYKEKEKRNNEGKQQLEREKRKREEEFQKLKIKKVNDLKFNSKMKKPMVLSKTSQIKFLGEPIPLKANTNNISVSENSSNNLNLTFGVINNNDEQNQNNLDKKDNNDNKPLFAALTENKNNENEKKIIDNKKQSIFADLIKDNNNEQEKKIENKQDTETKKETSLFSGSSTSLFNVPTTTTTTTPSLLFNPPVIKNINSENKKEEKQNTNENEKYNPFVMNSSNVTFGSGIKNEKHIFTANSNDNKQSIFFGNIKTDNKTDNKTQDGLFNSKKEEGSLFNQQTSVSKSINETSLFTSNQAGNKDQNQKSLLNKENPFLSAQNTNPIPNIFGSTKPDNNNQNNQQTQSLFGNTGGFNVPLFGTNPGKGLFN